MLKKIIKFEGIDGPVEQEYVFHISKTDFLEMDLEESGQLIARLQRLSQEQDNREIYNFFKEFVLRAVGVKSADGKRLVKTQQVRDEFGSSDAFSELIVGFLEDADSAGRFIAAVVPSASLTFDKETGALTTEAQEPVVPEEPSAPPRILTRAEMIGMDDVELRSGLATGRFVLGGQDLVVEG